MVLRDLQLAAILDQDEYDDTERPGQGSQHL